MLLEYDQTLKFADDLKKERKRQGLSRAQAASVCNVSISFIRDAETDPERCTFGLLLKLLKGLGLRAAVNGWDGEFGLLDEYLYSDQSPPDSDMGQL